MIPANSSLVKYSTPVLVSVAGKKKDLKKKPAGGAGGAGAGGLGGAGANINQS